MGNGGNTTPRVDAETVTALHARWRQRLDKLDLIPGCPTPRREQRLIECGHLEREIGETPARHIGEVILKIRMVLIGRTTAALSESILLAGAIKDLERMEKGA